MSIDSYTLRVTYRKNNELVRKIESKVLIREQGKLYGPVTHEETRITILDEEYNPLIQNKTKEMPKTVKGQISILEDKARIILYRNDNSTQNQESEHIKPISMIIADLNIASTATESDFSGVYAGKWKAIKYNPKISKKGYSEIWATKQEEKDETEEQNSIEILLLKLPK
jgi:hypothetical protein